MTIKKKFQHFQELYPELSSIINLGRAIMGTPQTTDEIKKLIRLLDRDDYSRAVLPQLVAHFVRMSKEPEFPIGTVNYSKTVKSNGSTKPRV